MSLSIFDILFCFLANAVRFYAIKRCIGMYVSQEECRVEHTFILYLIGWFLTASIGLLFSIPAYNVISNIVSLFLILFPYRIKWIKKCVIVFLIYGVNVMIDTIVILSFTKYAIGEPVNQIFASIANLLLLFVVLILEKTNSDKKKTSLPATHMIALGSVPLISIGCIYRMVLSLEQTKMIVFTASGFLFINILIFYLYHSLLDYYSEHVERELLEHRLEVYEYQLNVIQESQERVKALRHDLKHHIIELSSMITCKMSDDALKYLEQMSKYMLNTKEYAATGNKEIDGILNYQLQNAEKVLERVDIKVNIPEHLYSRNFLVCTILGNLLDNAIRAASDSEEKYLSIQMREQQNVLLIFIENSYSGTVVKENNIFRTTQKDSGIHGIGLEHVKQLVAANGGELKITYDKVRFCVHVLLYLSEIR